MVRWRELALLAASMCVWGALAQDAKAQVKPVDPQKAIRSFKLPKLPTTVEQTQCHMGECAWEQITSISDVKRHGSEVLRAVHSRSATTETPEGHDYPTTLDAHTQVTWRKSTSYVLCSVERPTTFWWDASEKSYVESPLHVVSPFGYETAAVTEYLMVCHGAKPGSNGAKHPAELGYVDRTDDMPQTQTHIADPKQFFGGYRR